MVEDSGWYGESKRHSDVQKKASRFKGKVIPFFEDAGHGWGKRIVDARTNDSVIVEGKSAEESEWSFVASFNSILEAENYIITRSEEAEGWDGEYFLRVKPQRRLLGSGKD